MNARLPERFASEAELDHLLSEPTAQAVEALRRCPGDIMLLGAGGKMGLSLARMVRRAADEIDSPRRVIAVSRFSDGDRERQLNEVGVETIRADLLDRSCLARLPDVPHVFAMTGHKFGTASNPALTWATNVVMPTLIAERFAHSNLVAFSTGNVYPLVDTCSRGSVETDPCQPLGEYAMSAVGRERVYDYFSQRGTRMALLRLNYAVEMRYGVLVDIARRVWAGEVIDLAMGHVNVIWQGDACAMSIAALPCVDSPPFILNIAGPEILRVRDVAEHFARLFGKPVSFEGSEQASALLSDGSKGRKLFGEPRVTADQIVTWIAGWIQDGGRQLGKPTHFEVTDGGF